MPEDNVIKTIGVCPECNEVVTGNQPWEMFNGRPIHSRCKPSQEEIDGRRDAVQGQDFPVLTRSQRVSAEALQALQRVDTGDAPEVKRTGRSRAPLDEATLRTLPETVERTLGEDHPESAKVLHRLAVLYHSKEKLEKAESCYRRALATAERAFSKPHPELGLILNNLGRLLYDQKKLAEVEKLYQRSLEVLRAALGPEHVKVATPMSNLANLYMDQGKRELAESLYGDSITILEKTLGPEHPKVTKARKKLAAWKQKTTE